MPSKVQLTGGAFQDSEGEVLDGGYLEFHLSQDGSVSGVGNICSGIAVRVQLDSDGNAASSTSTPTAADQYIWGNDNILPANTFYRVTGFKANGQPAWGPNNQQVTGSGTFDLGTWIPNQIISWVPSVQTPLIEVNGTPTDDQTVANFVAGTNITITNPSDGEILIAASGGGGLSGNGAFFLGPGVTDIALIYGSPDWGQVPVNLQNGSLTANQVVVYLFELQVAFTLSKCSTECSDNNGGATASFGIYSHAGSKLVDGGSFVTLNSSGVQTNTFTPVTLQPGTYWFAQAASNGTAQHFFGINVSSASNTNGMIDALLKNATRAAIATNAMASGILPATLGTLTPFTPSHTNADGIACPVFE